MQLVFEQIRTGGDRNFGYLLGDRDAGTCTLIDPSYSPDVLAQRAADQHLAVTCIINTHGHPDHINGNDRARALTKAPVAALAGSPLVTPDIGLGDGQELEIGSLRLQCLYVPGHCPDHIVIYEPAWKLLITGDILFVGKVGGTSSDDDARAEWESLRRIIAHVAEEATVWPGHDYGARPSSTMGLERATNPFLRCADASEFMAFKRQWPSFKQRLGLR